MKRRVALRALGLVLGWSSVGLMLSALSCSKTEAQFEQEWFNMNIRPHWNPTRQLEIANQATAAQPVLRQYSPQEVIDLLQNTQPFDIHDLRDIRNKNECPAGCPKIDLKLKF